METARASVRLGLKSAATLVGWCALVMAAIWIVWHFWIAILALLMIWAIFAWPPLTLVAIAVLLICL